MTPEFFSYLNHWFTRLNDPLHLRWLVLLSVLALIFLAVLFLFRVYRPHFFLNFHGSKSITPKRLLLLSLISFTVLIASLLGITVFPPAVIYPPSPLSQPLTVSQERPLVIVFNRPISRHIKPTISPNLTGTWHVVAHSYGPVLKNALYFTPASPVPPNSEYLVNLEQILPIFWLNLSTQSQKYLFAFTPTSPLSDLNLLSATSPPESDAPLSLLASEPVASASSIPTDTQIKLAFTQPIDVDQASAYISFSPSIPLNISQADSLVTLEPQSPLSFATQYTLTLNSGLPASGSATKLQSATSLTFTTSPEQFRLEVPLYKQHYTFTCYSVAARMALAYRNVTISEVGFLDQIGYDTTPRNYVTNVWGDPYQGVVGTHDGSGVGGYGAHWPAVAQAMSQYRQVEIKENWDIPGLLDAVAQKNPVLVWWVNGVWPAKDVSWNNAQGEKVYTVNGMHVEVVTGWVGNQHDPQYILTNDPWRGHRRYTPESFRRLWQWFNNSAIIVY